MRYTFTVNAREYTGSNVRIRSQGVQRQKLAEKRAAKYPVGSTIKHIYNPENPAESEEVR
ncbi:DUF3592 domain-containing protein [Rubritalea sp.]|uniref:DUF3592 domain-containing protein n=1 Tax=Rubritalea sp. TaxID=2109375 RepID=UPI003EF9BDD6